MINRRLLANRLHLTALTLTCVAAVAGCGARNLIGLVDGGPDAPTGTAGAGSAGSIAGAGVGPGTGGFGPAGAGGIILDGIAGSTGTAGSSGTAGSPCTPGLYDPATVGSGAGGSGNAGTGAITVAAPTPSSPFPVAPPVDYASAGYLSSLAVGDLNGDGKIDIVAGSESGMSVFMNKGSGSFSPAVKYDRGGMVALGDVSGDGKPDAVVVDDKDVYVWTNNGNGTFATPIAPVNRIRGTTLGFPALADLDLDGKLDIVVVDGGVSSPTGMGVTGAAMIMINQGGGKFATPYLTLVGNGANWLVLSDLNHDLCPDIVVSNYPDDSVTVVLGSCGGNFGGPQPLRTGGHPTGVAVGKLDPTSDTPDLVAAIEDPADVNVFLNQGGGQDGGLDGFEPVARYNAGAGTKGVALGDLNGDGRSDVAVSHVGGIGVLLNKGDGTFAAPLTALSPCGAREPSDTTPIALGDFDGDGRLDIAVISGVRGVMTVFLNRWH